MSTHSTTYTHTYTLIQIQDKTKDTIIQIIKEKEDLMRDTVDRKKCIEIYVSSKVGGLRCISA